jgi:hypothetical protein
MRNITTERCVVPTRQVLDLRRFMRSASHSVMCLGPMSRNVVDAIIAYANRLRSPIPIIASRRQVDAEEFGGGYVNQWNSRTFAEYIAARDKGYIHICRDHGGPWQGSGELELSQASAMKRAKAALLDDLVNGFNILHLDPSIHSASQTEKDVLDMLFELYAFVCDTARHLGRKIEIEVGAEQQSGRYSDAHELVGFLRAVTQFCEQEGYQKPLFCVVQTGTLVKEMRNVGLTEGRRNESVDQRYAVDTMEKMVRHLVDIAWISGVFVKEHNGDYLSDGSMSLRRRLGVGGVNIAPELGVFESKTLVRLCLEYDQKDLLERMLQVFYESKKWEKWLSEQSHASDFDRAIIAGHYTFSTPEFLEVKSRLEHVVKQRGGSIDAIIQESLISQLQRLAWNLGYMQQSLAYSTLRDGTNAPIHRVVTMESTALEGQVEAHAGATQGVAVVSNAGSSQLGTDK